MKLSKKNPRKQLEKYSAIFVQLSLVLVLFIVYQVIEYKTPIDKPLAFNTDFEYNEVYMLNEPITYRVKKNIEKKPKEESKPKVIEDLSKVEVIDVPDVLETDVIDDPIDEDNNVETALNSFVEPLEETPEEDVDFIRIEEAPIFKGCEGLSKEENKKCFEKKIRQFVSSKFDLDLASDLGLNSGKYKIFTEFIITKTGVVSDIRVRAPHPTLKKEVSEIVSKLPKFTPGKQRNIPVKVRYVLPISFQVE